MSLRYDPAAVVISQGLETGEVVVTAGVQMLRPGQKVRAAGSRVMKRFNLSEWAIRHRSLVTYFMLVIVVAGIGSYLRLGRSEDPDFTVKTMVVQAAWPGATVGDTLEQITDRIESKLQETPSLDYLKSYTSAGQATIFVNLKDFDAPGAGAGHLVPGAQEGAATSATRCRKGSSAPASTTSSATPTASSTASPRTASPTAS